MKPLSSVAAKAVSLSVLISQKAGDYLGNGTEHQFNAQNYMVWVSKNSKGECY